MSELKISQANQDDIAVWKNLQRYPAWKRICQERMKEVEKADAIINTIGFDREKMFSERDIALIKKQAILEFINFPQTQINQLSGTGVLEKPDVMDPFRDLEEGDEDDDLGDDL